MSKTNTACPFCGDGMEMEIYKHKAGTAPSMQMSCQNPKCPVKPISVEASPLVCMDDVKAMGYYEQNFSVKQEESPCNT